MSKKGIDSRAFMNQSTLISVKLGSECNFIGESAFENCTSLNEINGDNMIETIASNAFAGSNLPLAVFDNLNTLYNGAFSGCSNLSYINITNCTNIPKMAFANCISLEKIEIPNVYTIGESAFTGCSSLTSINVPYCSIIGERAFKECINLKDIYFDVNFEIGEGAFESCANLSNLNLKKCTKIGENAFNGCTNLTQIELSICSSIDAFAFKNCPNLTKVYINNPDDIPCVLNSKYVFCDHDDTSADSSHNNITFYFRAETLGSYKSDPNWMHYADNMIMMAQHNQIIYTTNDNKAIDIDDTIRATLGITSNTYNTNYGLIEFDKTVNALTKEIFGGSKTLTSVDLPLTCESIDDNAFNGCQNLNSITPSSELLEIGEYAFKDCESFTSFVIPETVTLLGEGAFAGCKNIEKIEGIFSTYNGRAAVCNNTLICVLAKDNSATEGRIHNISDINTNITRLGKSCFYGCVNMRRVNIPSNIDEIGDGAFESCQNLYEIHLDRTTPPGLGTDVFKDIREDFKIFVPEASLTKYSDVEGWSEYASHIYPKPASGIIYYSDDDTQINSSEHVDVGCENGNYYKISKNISTIPMNYFRNYENITKVILSENIVNIGLHAFMNFKNLDYVYLSDSIKTMQMRCFYGCEKLTKIHIPSGLSSINLGDSVPNLPAKFGSDIFIGCKNLKEFGTYYKGRVSEDNRCYIGTDNELKFFAQGSMTDDEKAYSIPDNVISINNSAFRDSDLTSIRLCSSTTKINSYAFKDCKNLQTIENWDCVETISSQAFDGCTSLGKISLPNNLQIIDEYAFSGCENMYINTNIPNSVISINSYAFTGCSSFKCVDDNTGEEQELGLGNITDINASTFKNCVSLTKVNINDKINTIGSNAFEGCSSLSSVSISGNSTLSAINENAFSNCTELSTFNLPYSLTSIGNYAFENCKNYNGLIPSSIKSLGIACFKNSGIEVLYISESSELYAISDSAFENCKNLKNLNIQNAKNIHTIGANAFANCSNLCYDNKQLILPNTIATIKDNAFKDCVKIQKTTLPTNLVSLGDNSFNLPLASIYIPIELSFPPIFTKSGTKNTFANPFGDMLDIATKKPIIYLYESIRSTYEKNIYWSKYKSLFITLSDTTLEDYIGQIVCDTNGFEQVVGSDWGAYVVIKKNIPSAWVDTIIHFKVYNENKELILYPSKWSFTLSSEAATGGLPQMITIAEGMYSTLGGTSTNPAKYIKITFVSNSEVKYRGDYINVSNY